MVNNSRIPVSYTHLDVYKRQVETVSGFGPVNIPVLSDLPIVGPILFQQSVMTYLASVSYTHLDVYKRQAWGRARWPSALCWLCWATT